MLQDEAAAGSSSGRSGARVDVERWLRRRMGFVSAASSTLPAGVCSNAWECWSCAFRHALHSCPVSLQLLLLLLLR